MSLDDDRRKAAHHAYPEQIPVAVSILPATWMHYREALDELVAGHPSIFPEHRPGERDYDEASGNYVAGEHVDEWGCVWTSLRTGLDSMVKGHPVPTREAVRTLRMPAEVTGQMRHGFMYLRLGDLRGFEEIMADWAEEPPELQMLIDLVLAYNMQQLEARLRQHTGWLINFGDDLGMQDRLPISPLKWRRYLKPCYARLYGRCHEAGLDVYMHTDGHIVEVIPDLIEAGVDVLNPQVRANGLEVLAGVARGRVCINLDLDRQLFPFCTPADIDAHVRQAIETLGSPEGGLWLQAEIGPDVPLANIEAICTALETYRDYYR